MQKVRVDHVLPLVRNSSKSFRSHFAKAEFYELHLFLGVW